MPTGNFEPIDKPKRHVDEALLAAIRALGFCERCGRTFDRIDPHHVKTRGSGGGDYRRSVVGLCLECHDKAHRALISKDELFRIATHPDRWIPGYDDVTPDE